MSIKYPGYAVKWDDPNPEYGLALFLTKERAEQHAIKKRGELFGLLLVSLKEDAKEIKNKEEN